jgi:hypothetical protein
VKIKSRIGNFTTDLECFVLPKITRATPAISFNKSAIEIPGDITLADPDFNVSQEIDLLIGTRLYWQFLIGRPSQLHKKQPYFQETVFGWLISGDLDLKNLASKFACTRVIQKLRLQHLCRIEKCLYSIEIHRILHKYIKLFFPRPQEPL